MSTWCAIGLKEQDGSVTAIRCFYDGYPAGVGRTLSTSYNEEKKIRRLLEFRDINTLKENVEDCDELDPPVLSSIHFSNVDDYRIHGFKAFYAEYLYLYEESQWVYCEGTQNQTFRPLSFTRKLNVSPYPWHVASTVFWTKNTARIEDRKFNTIVEATQEMGGFRNASLYLMAKAPELFNHLEKAVLALEESGFFEDEKKQENTNQLSKEWLKEVHDLLKTIDRECILYRVIQDNP